MLLWKYRRECGSYLAKRPNRGPQQQKLNRVRQEFCASNASIGSDRGSICKRELCLDGNGRKILPMNSFYRNFSVGLHVAGAIGDESLQPKIPGSRLMDKSSVKSLSVQCEYSSDGVRLNSSPAFQQLGAPKSAKNFDDARAMASSGGVLCWSCNCTEIWTWSSDEVYWGSVKGWLTFWLSVQGTRPSRSSKSISQSFIIQFSALK
ncbi:hypothetical protein PsorP6_014124 [Peronosclerospora sorghi]|uniref:Uncharacterized protein n=1 Tax=Peronosclerospora sorghi TaxID=230839 RepID=A0ACC0VH65_9STRA|nr:hypothetical protein PsorP6_014124 [Peronosclerospora sorghi]